jgi:hypothetical protein
VRTLRAPPCARCGAKLKVVRSIRRLGLTLPQYASSSAPGATTPCYSKAVTTQTGTKKKPRLCEPGLSCAVVITTLAGRDCCHATRRWTIRATV